MKIAALTFSAGLFVLLSLALLQNPSSAGSDAMPVSPVPSSSTNTGNVTNEISDARENPPVQHVGVGENQPL